ncbi:dihydrodipicolinate synthase family protein [Sporolactobacillus terrae]|uniref:Dihydrodipicolinate synthase family protein n=1 Tax=Sporolactobacillus terrae TaxID=269673 RepID=A0ABX5QA67_9BACL|nr:dihydrodipicolinate synthase family protein [Sporolactobacillus terrae]QAA23519.1 dihydrodipicolinate synthase family protein [Sporolactobacillus terrae]QAA26489.1 dihydrodipicolinate synthase family protein [Sporolactobacillus terrae]UAK15575.1 dihydrodipicolinate synthase family protein [Sporolactobacillus terrae]
MNKPFLPFSVAMITPFSTNGDLYLKGIPPLIEYYKKQGVPALLISGSTGEQHSMTYEERAALFSEVKKEAKDDLILYGGVAAVRTKDAMALAVSAEKSGLDSIMLGFPPYLRISQQEAITYVEKICHTTTLPIMLYNNPPRTGFDLHLETLFKLIDKNPQIVAFKQAGNPNTVPHIKKQLGKAFMVLSGDDLSLIKNHQLGFDGITSIIGNIFPNEIQFMIKAIHEGKTEAGEKQLTKLLPYIHSIMEMGTLRSVKYLFEKQKIDVGICREPLSVLSEEEKKIIDQAFSK